MIFASQWAGAETRPYMISASKWTGAVARPYLFLSTVHLYCSPL